MSGPGAGGADSSTGGDGLKTIAVLGTGLMGGSIGLACLERGLAKTVVGYDVDAKRLQQALEKGAITKAAAGAPQAVSEAQLVFIATPVSVIADIFEQIAPSLPEGAIVTDVGSTKAKLVEQISAANNSKAGFIGGHPIAGSEAEGIHAASADLYTGSLWVLTPTAETDTSAYRDLVQFLTKLGARVISLEPLRHDEAVALTSHLPQLLSSTLMGFAAEVAASADGMPLLTAGGFRDMTRIAGSSPKLWLDIARDNRPALLDVLKRFRGALESAEQSLASEDWPQLEEMLAGARSARRALPGKPGVQTQDLVEIRIPVPDRTGVLAEVTTTLGEVGVNIEDIDIVHSPEGGRGVVHLSVAGRDTADKACDAIAQKGYAPEIEE